MKTIQLGLAILFCIAVSTCTEDNTGTNTASGTYTWNSDTGVLTMNWTSSDFTCQGPEVGGTDTMTGVIVTSTTMTWGGEDQITWSRTSGTAGDIVGKWTAESPNGNSYTATFNANGTVSVDADIVNCDDKETRTASGTYTWNSVGGVITWNFTSSDFTCNGPQAGVDSVTGVTITSTTMAWAGDKDSMTWHRPSGTAGNIVGTWTFDDPDGNSYTLTFNANNTVFLTMTGTENCEGSARAEAQHWSSGYSVQFKYDDPDRTATSVSVTGHGISGSKALTYNTDEGQWDTWTSPSTNLDLGINYPAGLPYTYTFSITDNTGTWTATSTVDCFQQNFATNLSPSGTVTGTITFSWTGINDVNARYQVQLNSNSGGIWDSPEMSGTSVMYSGPALTPATTYYYKVVVNRSSACDGESFAQDSFTYQ